MLLLPLLPVILLQGLWAISRPRDGQVRQELDLGIHIEKDCGCGLKPPGPDVLDCNYRNGLKDCYQPALQVKCCEPSCPKCVGGLAPRPGTNGCLFGCPDGASCPGTCPCDECVCCFTTTRWLTETSTCLDSTTLQVQQVDTSTEQRYFSTITTLTVPVTFTVEDIFSFTVLETDLFYPTGPTTSTTTIVSMETETSAVHASTETLIAILFTFQEVSTATEFVPIEVTETDLQSTEFLTLRFSLLLSTTTVFTAFSYSATGFVATSSVGITDRTYYDFIYPEGILSQATQTIETAQLSVIPKTATETVYDCRTAGLTCPFLVPTYTEQVLYTPTTTFKTTVPAPPYFNLPFFPQ